MHAINIGLKKFPAQKISIAKISGTKGFEA